jgi:hypothetical protein
LTYMFINAHHLNLLHSQFFVPEFNLNPYKLISFFSSLTTQASAVARDFEPLLEC